MKKPYVLAIDDDLSVLRAVERDLKTKFSSNYRILAIDSPQKAISVVRQLTSRADRVALFLVDQHATGFRLQRDHFLEQLGAVHMRNASTRLAKSNSTTTLINSKTDRLGIGRPSTEPMSSARDGLPRHTG